MGSCKIMDIRLEARVGQCQVEHDRLVVRAASIPVMDLAASLAGVMVHIVYGRGVNSICPV